MRIIKTKSCEKIGWSAGPRPRASATFFSLFNSADYVLFSHDFMTSIVTFLFSLFRWWIERFWTLSLAKIKWKIGRVPSLALSLSQAFAEYNGNSLARDEKINEIRRGKSWYECEGNTVDLFECFRAMHRTIRIGRRKQSQFVVAIYETKVLYLSLWHWHWKMILFAHVLSRYYKRIHNESIDAYRVRWCISKFTLTHAPS